MVSVLRPISFIKILLKKISSAHALRMDCLLRHASLSIPLQLISAQHRFTHYFEVAFLLSHFSEHFEKFLSLMVEERRTNIC